MHLRRIGDHAWFAEAGTGMSVIESNDCSKLEFERYDIKDMWLKMK